MSVKLIVMLILTGLAVIFITQNVAPVEVTFLFWSVALSRALLIFFAVVIGLVMGWFLRSYFSYRQSRDRAFDEQPPPSKTP